MFYQSEEKKHLTVYNLIDLLRREQGNSEFHLTQLNCGGVNKSKATTIQKNLKLFNIVSSYNYDEMEEYLNRISLVLDNIEDDQFFNL